MYIPDSVNEFAAQTVCTVPNSSHPVVEGLPGGAENNKTSETTLIKPFGQLLHRKQYPTCESVLPIYLEFCRLMALHSDAHRWSGLAACLGGCTKM